MIPPLALHALLILAVVEVAGPFLKRGLRLGPEQHFAPEAEIDDIAFAAAGTSQQERQTSRPLEKGQVTIDLPGAYLAMVLGPLGALQANEVLANSSQGAQHNLVAFQMVQCFW